MADVMPPALEERESSCLMSPVLGGSMRFRTFAIAAALCSGLVGLSETGHAFAPHKGAETTVTAGRAARLHRDVTWRAPQGALDRLPGWSVIWDRDTDVPLRLWGAPIAAPG